MIRLYHIVAINERKGWKVRMTAYPTTHQEACVILSKIGYHPVRRAQLEEYRKAGAS
jgi:hypothetical protein